MTARRPRTREGMKRYYVSKPCRATRTWSDRTPPEPDRIRASRWYRGFRAGASTRSKSFGWCQAERHAPYRPDASGGTDHATHRSTPPERRSRPRQVSWLADRRPCPAFPVTSTSDPVRQRLTAHSCGGSFGIARTGSTEFPLSSRYRTARTLTVRRFHVPPVESIRCRKRRYPGRAPSPAGPQAAPARRQLPEAARPSSASSRPALRLPSRRRTGGARRDPDLVATGHDRQRQRP